MTSSWGSHSPPPSLLLFHARRDNKAFAINYQCALKLFNGLRSTARKPLTPTDRPNFRACVSIYEIPACFNRLEWNNPSFARSKSSKIVLILIPLFERLTVKSNKCIYVRFICFNFPSRFEIESKNRDRFTESNLTQSQTRIKFEDKLVFQLKSLIKKEIILPILLTNSLINLYPLQFLFRMKQKKNASRANACIRALIFHREHGSRATLSYPLVPSRPRLSR